MPTVHTSYYPGTCTRKSNTYQPRCQTRAQADVKTQISRPRPPRDRGRGRGLVMPTAGCTLHALATTTGHKPRQAAARQSYRSMRHLQFTINEIGSQSQTLFTNTAVHDRRWATRLQLLLCRKTKEPKSKLQHYDLSAAVKKQSNIKHRHKKHKQSSLALHSAHSSMDHGSFHHSSMCISRLLAVECSLSRHVSCLGY